MMAALSGQWKRSTNPEQLRFKLMSLVSGDGLQATEAGYPDR
jgi:hypothetical protein